MKKLLVLFVLVANFIVFVTVGAFYATATESEIHYEQINPDSTIGYPVKRLVEKVQETINSIFDKGHKAKFMTQLSDRRLAELMYIVNTEKVHYLEKTASRYISQLGLISEELGRTMVDADFVKAHLDKHIAALEEIKDKFELQSAQWLFIQQALETSKVTLSNALTG